MIRNITARLQRSSDAGISLVEVIVALMIFAMLAVGMSYSLLTMQRLTADNERRSVASALAAGEIDRVLGLANPFGVEDLTTSRTVGGVTYRIEREANWKSDSSAEGSTCGTSGGNLLYKMINVSVKWDGMLILKNPVRADTLLSPEERLNQPGLGTILIAVNTEAGVGRAGVAVTITPKSGGTGAAVGTVPVTTAGGCSFALRVKPGDYVVTLSRSNFVDTEQVATPTVDPVTVTADATQTVTVQYDERVRLDTNYRPDRNGARLPTTMDSTFFASGRTYSYPTVAVRRDFHPFRDGYTGVAGRYAAPTETDARGCTNVDPAAWPEGDVNGTMMRAGETARATVSAPGATGKIDIRMGIIKIRTPNLSGGTITAKSADPALVTYPGDPGCSVSKAMTYTFSGLSNNQNYELALPYGSWQLRTGTTVLNTNITLDHTLGAVTGSIITLDPREPAP